ncbi:MAG: type II toxin-antitoxin system VapC family toxin [Candidatus Njordarchaeales archaeon]
MIVSTDSSVLVKWFKKGEEKEELAMRLKDDVLDERIVLLCNEWVQLEIIRALTKANYSRDKINETRRFLEDIGSLGLIKFVRVSEVKELALEMIYSLNLYTADAVILATAIINNVDLLTEDSHLLKNRIIKYAEKHGVRIFTLDGYYRHLGT